MRYSEDVLIKIYESQHERFHQSRNLQWRMNVTFWTLIVLAIYYHENFKIDWLSISICIVLFILHFMFTLVLQQNLETDKKIWCDILDYLNKGFTEGKEFEIKIKERAAIKNFEFRSWFWIVFQLSISFILFVIFLTT